MSRRLNMSLWLYVIVALGGVYPLITGLLGYGSGRPTVSDQDFFVYQVTAMIAILGLVAILSYATAKYSIEKVALVGTAIGAFLICAAEVVDWTSARSLPIYRWSSTTLSYITVVFFLTALVIRVLRERSEQANSDESYRERSVPRVGVLFRTVSALLVLIFCALFAAIYYGGVFRW